MYRRSLLLAGGVTVLASPLVRSARANESIDVALVLAVDVSRSVDDDEAKLQREGYRAAVSDPKIVEAIRGGMMGAIGIAYVEWAGIEYQRLVLPWMRIGNQVDADAWAAALDAAPRASLSWTSISGGIDFGRRVMAECPWEATRRVMDVSGDGVNNSGPPVEQARDLAVAEGITINGLPIVNNIPTSGTIRPVPLDIYYRDAVIGGTGAFLVVAEDFNAFGQAVRRKLVREIAGIDGPVMMQSA